MKKVLVFGSFDILHPGHLYFLRQAKGAGDKLYVVVARDSTIYEVKGKKPKNSEIDRLKKVKQLPMVDGAVLGSAKDKYAFIRKLKPDVICLGHDQKAFTYGLKDALSEEGLDTVIIKVKPYKRHIYRSSILRKNKLKF